MKWKTLWTDNSSRYQIIAKYWAQILQPTFKKLLSETNKLDALPA